MCGRRNTQRIDHKPILLKQASNKEELTNSEIILTTKADLVIASEIPPADYLS